MAWLSDISARMIAALLGFSALILIFGFIDHSSLWCLPMVGLSAMTLMSCIMLLHHVARQKIHVFTSLAYGLAALVLGMAGTATVFSTCCFAVLAGVEILRAKTDHPRTITYCAALALAIGAFAFARPLPAPSAALIASANVFALLHVLSVIGAYGMGLRAHYHRYFNQHHLIEQALSATDVMSFMHDENGDITEVIGALPAGMKEIFAALRGRQGLHAIHIADRPLYLKTLSDVWHGAAQQAIAVRLLPNQTKTPATVHTHIPQCQNFDVTIRKASPHHVISCWRRDEADRANANTPTAQGLSDQAVAMMSHELRTPLNAIIGFSAILADPHFGDLDAAKRLEYAGLIHQSGHHLLDVVTSILDMSKLQNGHYDLLPEPFDLIDVIGQCRALLALSATEHDISIRVEHSAPAITINADRKALMQIILNLLSNAIKFSPAHSTVSLSAQSIGTSVALRVADCGIGIGAEDLQRLGQPFFQAKNTYTRRHQGTGLGLSVVKELVRLHKGSMSIESAEHQGTSVYISLPVDVESAGLVAHAGTNIETLAHHRRDQPLTHHSTQVKKIA